MPRCRACCSGRGSACIASQVAVGGEVIHEPPCVFPYILVTIYGKITGCVKITSAPMAAADPTTQPAAVRRSCRAAAPLAGWLCSAAACDASSAGLDTCRRRLAAVDLEDTALVAKQAAAEEEIRQVCGPTCNTRSRCGVSVVSVLLIGRKMQLVVECARCSRLRRSTAKDAAAAETERATDEATRGLFRTVRAPAAPPRLRRKTPRAPGRSSAGAPSAFSIVKLFSLW
jgi:hypothetical protein